VTTETDTTLAWYDANAADYAERTESFDAFPGLEDDAATFLRMVRPGGTILDLGSGGGRDAEYFAKASHKVIALDRSAPLLQTCLHRTDGLSVHGVVADLRNLPIAPATIEGVWACGTLLHLKRDEIPRAILRVADILRPSAPFGLSMKLGVGEKREPDGRWFTYVLAEELSEWLHKGGLNPKRISGPDRKGWLLALSEKGEDAI
jgi:SAM-dependent methyltransferase